MTFETLIQYDLVVRRGGNKERLVARCYLAALRDSNAAYIEREAAFCK